MSNRNVGRRLLCGALMGSMGLTACGPLDLSMEEKAPVAASCDELKASGSLTEGNHVLYLNKDNTRPFVAWCSAEGGTFLTLAAGPEANYAQNLNVEGASVTTRWTRVRFDPATLTIDGNDFTFATSSGYVPKFDQHTVTYGSASDCAAPNSSSGRASVDLTGLPFAVTSKWTQHGYLPAGDATRSSNDQVITVTGGGYCGTVAIDGPMTLSYNKSLLR